MGECHASVVLYDRPVADLMVEASAALSERFRPNDIVEWFAQHYPKVKASTVRAHVIGLTANDPSRKHFAGLARRQPLFFKSPNGWLERFDPDVHLTDEPVDSYPDDGEELELVESEDMEPTHPKVSRGPRSSTSRRIWRSSSSATGHIWIGAVGFRFGQVRRAKAVTSSPRL